MSPLVGTARRLGDTWGERAVVRVRAVRLRGRPLPRVRARTGPWVPGGLLRVLFVASVVLMVLAAGARTELLATATGVAATGLAGWALLRPGHGPALGAVVTAGALLLGSPSAPMDPAVLLLAPLAHVVVRLGWWAGHVAWSTHVTVTALARSAVRDVGVVGVTVAIGGAALLAAGHPVHVGAFVGALALLAVAWLALRYHDGRDS
ncbi:hypothetical protein DNL40_14310 [Xylanimonas oleitrophica]|uniref:Uncharacterized protein n=1 Tax=Xylanimonas oleitrophica TaxID=2607479 RepID=A0A2W5Y2T7_9MICO|nr:hypothetical protein [Xylanimonas oleitrophica]PZR51984.1 hypothetical protein DNL40_14310 [Xylanimonas oleitrophica]